MFAFRINGNAGIEDYSQVDGFHGWLRFAMPSSTSFMKPSSSVAAESRASANAIASDKSRPLPCGVLMTATG